MTTDGRVEFLVGRELRYNSNASYFSGRFGETMNSVYEAIEIGQGRRYCFCVPLLEQKERDLMSEDTLTSKTETQAVTFINIFHTQDPEDQQKVVASLIQVTEEVMKPRPAFISATIHQSPDGKSVINVARWRSAEEFKETLATPAMLAHRDVLGSLYKREGYLTKAVFSYSAQKEESAPLG
jgi:Antibiotic biosynthesis monooxygenase